MSRRSDAERLRELAFHAWHHYKDAEAAVVLAEKGIPKAAHAVVAGYPAATLRRLARDLGLKGLSSARKEDILAKVGVAAH